MTPDIISLAGEVLDKARGAGFKIATAESCTGGLAAAALTSIAGSSDVFERGFVTYSNEAKAEMLGVDPALIAAHGAVSREVAIAMAACGLPTAGRDEPGTRTGTEPDSSAPGQVRMTRRPRRTAARNACGNSQKRTATAGTSRTSARSCRM